MLKIDYLLKTDKGVKVDENVPRDEMREIDGNIMMVEGPSSLGKSTVMNMIAVGSYGETNEYLSSSVRADLHELTSASYRDLQFDIELSDKVTDTTLKMSKASGKKDLKVIEIKDGKQSYLSEEAFRRKYNLIYDVPEKPTKRLEQIRDTITNDHVEIKSKLDAFFSYVKTVKNNIQHAPSQISIDEDRKNYREVSAEIEKLNESIAELKEKKVNAECALHCFRYTEIQKQIDVLQKRIDDESKKPVKPKTSGEVKTAAISKYVDNLSKVQLKQKTRNEIICSKNADLIRQLRMLDQIDIETDYRNLEKYSIFISEMARYVPKTSEDKETQHIQLIDSLLRILEKYDQKTSLGDLGKVSDVIEALSRYKESDEMTDKVDYSGIRKELSSIIMNLPAQKVLAENIMKAKDAPSVVGQDKQLIAKWNGDKNKLIENKSAISNELRKNGVDMTNVLGEYQKFCSLLKISIISKEADIEYVANSARQEYSAAESKLSNSRTYSENLKARIYEFEHSEKPKFYDDSGCIYKVVDTCNDIRTCINAADSRLKKVILHDNSEYVKKPELYQNIWDYIGYKLEKVRDCGTTYKVSSVDLLVSDKGDIVTEDGVVVHIGAMGTGEGQLSYLRGLLTTGDDRMIIALFDEVGNMSNNLIKILTEDFKSLQKSGKLMLAFMARPTNDEYEVKLYD